MIPAHVVEFETPAKVRLNGLWFGTKKPKRVIVWVHGLGSSAFSRRDIVAHLAQGGTAVLTFNNRGHDLVARVSKGKKSMLAGTAHEVFAESVDDIGGAVAFAHAQGAHEVFLAGHSTGCQKAVLYATKKKGRGISGIILLAPLADYVTLSETEKQLYSRALKKAQALIAAGKPHELLPENLWTQPFDAQRFVSLFTPDSLEQSLFPYFDEARSVRLFASVKLPMLVLLAGADEYADRPVAQIAAWFARAQRSARFDMCILSDVGHSFTGAEASVADSIRRWIR